MIIQTFWIFELPAVPVRIIRVYCIWIYHIEHKNLVWSSHLTRIESLQFLVKLYVQYSSKLYVKWIVIAIYARKRSSHHHIVDFLDFLWICSNDIHVCSKFPSIAFYQYCHLPVLPLLFQSKVYILYKRANHR